MSSSNSSLSSRLGDHARALGGHARALGGLARALGGLAEHLDVVETRSRRRGDTDTASAIEHARRELRRRADDAAEMADDAEGLEQAS